MKNLHVINEENLSTRQLEVLKSLKTGYKDGLNTIGQVWERDFEKVISLGSIQLICIYLEQWEFITTEKIKSRGKHLNDKTFLLTR